MKVLFLNRSVDIGGAERQLVSTAVGLRQRGHDVAVAVFYAGYPYERELHEAGVPLFDLGKSGRWDLAGFMLRLTRLLRRERPDVLYAFKGEANILGALARPFMKSKLVWGVRSSDVDLGDYGFGARAAYRLECTLAGTPDLIIANSRFGLEYARSNGFPEGRSVVIPNGFDTGWFRCDPAARQRFREEIGVPADALLIGKVGRIDPVKDYGTFLKAAAHLTAMRSDLRFVCVAPGEGAYADAMRGLAEELALTSRLTWCGARSDMTNVYNALDVLVSSSRSEGFPNVIGEAMACGTPCVVTDVGDAAWIVGDCGEVVAAGDPEALAVATARMLGRIAAGDVTSERVRNRLVAEFSRDRLLDATEAVLVPLGAKAASR